MNMNNIDRISLIAELSSVSEFSSVDFILLEVHVIPKFELVLSRMQTTSQSLVTQLTKPKMFFDTPI